MRIGVTCRGCGTDIDHLARGNYCEECQHSRRLKQQADWYARNKKHKRDYSRTYAEQKDPINQKCIEALPWNHACNEQSDKSINDVINDTLKKVAADKLVVSTDGLVGGEDTLF